MLSHAHTGEKVRSDAFDLLVLVGEKILELPSTNETEDEHDVTMNDYLLLLAAGLAASSNHVCLELLESLCVLVSRFLCVQMISGATIAIARVVYEV